MISLCIEKEYATYPNPAKATMVLQKMFDLAWK